MLRDPLILASGSPRRKEILAAAGIPFRVRAANIPEELLPGEAADVYVRRLARAKAEAVEDGTEAVILAADTVVTLDEHILEKPADATEAARMLALLSGRTHTVITGYCLRWARRQIVGTESTAVRFITLSPHEIAGYVASGEPMDKAGGYAIQGLASKFIDRVEGCYFNVVGLPVARVFECLKRIGREED